MIEPKATAMTRALGRTAVLLALVLGTDVLRAETPQAVWVPAQPEEIGGPWAVQGPGPSQNGQLEGIPNRPVTGAINALAPHPTNAAILYLGAVNGGVWRTTNATAASPVWTPLMDTQSSLSIGRDALQFDPTDPTANTLVAGSGRSSSFSSNGGARIGLFRTTDGGTTWTVLTGGATSLVGRNATGVAARGAVLMMTVNNFNGTFDVNNVGLFRSTDTGANFTRVSGSSGLPPGAPSTWRRIPRTTRRSTRASTARVPATASTSRPTPAPPGRASSDAAINALVLDTTSNVKISVGLADNVFVAIANGGALAGIFRSGNGGGIWQSLSLPVPTINPGGQGGTHFSLVASRANPNVVFIGGDRQNTPFPNDVGAIDFSGGSSGSTRRSHPAARRSTSRTRTRWARRAAAPPTTRPPTPTRA